jgi:hypothetical protein
VICPEHAKTIHVNATWRAEITVRRTLVCLDRPERGDLRDTYPVEPQMALSSFFQESPDAREIRRRRRGRGTIVIDWEPREKVIPNALYVHQTSWVPSGSYGQPALFTESQCDARTGILTVEISTPAAFEAAVAFRRPRWRRMHTERSLVKYALAQLQAGGQRPEITEDRRRVRWTLAGPKPGRRYVCVAFHDNGVGSWHERIKETSFVSRMRRLIRPLVPA